MTEQQQAVISYELRNISNQVELEQWFDFVYEIFKEKTTREYFVNHHFNDPNSDFKSILVAIINNKPSSSLPSIIEIVGSVKIFHRKIQINNLENNNAITTCACKGIGEVGTRSDMRNKKIAHSLLKKAIQQMKDDSSEEIVISSLHAAPSVCDVYRKVGWQSIPLCYSTLSLTIEKKFLSEDDSSPYTVLKNIDFSQEIVLQDIMSLYSRFCRKYQFHGCEVRDPNYWKKWVSHESKTHQCSSLALMKENSIIGYLFIGPDGQNPSSLKMKEFACSDELESEDVWKIFVTLLAHYVTLQEPQIQVTLPHSLLLQAFTSAIPLSCNTNTLCFSCKLDSIKEKSSIDEGCMYRAIRPEDNALLNKIISEEKHLVWKTDGF